MKCFRCWRVCFTTSKMEKTKIKPSGKTSSSDDRNIPSIDLSDHASSSSLLVSQSAQGLEKNPTNLLSEERSGHASENTAGSFPMDPQTVESTVELGNRASSSLPGLFSASVFPSLIPFRPGPSLAPRYASMMPPLRNVGSDVTYIEVINGVSRVLHYNPHMPPDQFPYTTPATESDHTQQKSCSLGNQEVERSDETSQQASSSLSLEPSSSSKLQSQSKNYSSSLTSTISIISTESNVEVISPFSEGQTSTLTAATNSTISYQATVTNNNPGTAVRQKSFRTNSKSDSVDRKTSPSPEKNREVFDESEQSERDSTGSSVSAISPQLKHSSAKKRKKHWRKSRTRFTPEQLEILQREFNLNPALSRRRKKEIALRTNLTEEIVQTWFSNNRYKMKVKMNENARNPSSKQDVFDESSQQASSSSSVLPSTSHEHDTEIPQQTEIVIDYSPPASGSCSNTDDVSNVVRFQQENSDASS